MRKLTLSIVSCLSNSYIVMIMICSAEKLADVSLSWWSCSHFMMAEAIKRCDPRMKEQYWIPWSQMWIMPRKILSCHSSWKMSKICQRLYLTNVLRQENSIEVNRCALSIISRFQMPFIQTRNQDHDLCEESLCGPVCVWRHPVLRGLGAQHRHPGHEGRGHVPGSGIPGHRGQHWWGHRTLSYHSIQEF